MYITQFTQLIQSGHGPLYQSFGGIRYNDIVDIITEYIVPYRAEKVKHAFCYEDLFIIYLTNSNRHNRSKYKIGVSL